MSFFKSAIIAKIFACVPLSQPKKLNIPVKIKNQKIFSFYFHIHLVSAKFLILAIYFSASSVFVI